MAAREGCKNIVEYLVGQGAKINSIDEYQVSNTYTDISVTVTELFTVFISREWLF